MPGYNYVVAIQGTNPKILQEAVIPYSMFFEGQKFHKFYESIAIRENFTLEILPLQMC